MSSVDGSSLCAQCGLCCSGAFFEYVPLQPGEGASLKRHGLVVVQREKDEGLCLPCPKHTGSSCSIYADRPARCAEYRCGLLRQLDDKKLSFDEALAIVVKTRALASTLREALPKSEAPRSLVDASDQLWEGDSGAAWRRDHGALLLDIAVFLALTRRHFGVGEPDKDASPKDRS